MHVNFRLTLNRVKTLDYGQVAQFAVEHTNFKHLNLYCGKIKRSILAKVAKYVWTTLLRMYGKAYVHMYVW